MISPVTSFNVKKDLKDHYVVYTTATLLALSLIALSVAQPCITRLNGINRFYFLGGAGLVIGAELFALKVRNSHQYVQLSLKEIDHVTHLMAQGKLLICGKKGHGYLQGDDGLVEYTDPNEAIQTRNLQVVSIGFIQAALNFKEELNDSSATGFEDDLQRLKMFMRKNEVLRYRTPGYSHSLMDAAGEFPKKELPEDFNGYVTLKVLRFREANK